MSADMDVDAGPVLVGGLSLAPTADHFLSMVPPADEHCIMDLPPAPTRGVVDMYNDEDMDGAEDEEKNTELEEYLAEARDNEEQWDELERDIKARAQHLLPMEHFHRHQDPVRQAHFNERRKMWLEKNKARVDAAKNGKVYEASGLTPNIVLAPPKPPPPSEAKEPLKPPPQPHTELNSLVSPQTCATLDVLRAVHMDASIVTPLNYTFPGTTSTAAAAAAVARPTSSSSTPNHPFPPSAPVSKSRSFQIPASIKLHKPNHQKHDKQKDPVPKTLPAGRYVVIGAKPIPDENKIDEASIIHPNKGEEDNDSKLTDVEKEKSALRRRWIKRLMIASKVVPSMSNMMAVHANAQSAYSERLRSNESTSVQAKTVDYHNRNKNQWKETETGQYYQRHLRRK